VVQLIDCFGAGKVFETVLLEVFQGNVGRQMIAHQFIGGL